MFSSKKRSAAAAAAATAQARQEAALAGDRLGISAPQAPMPTPPHIRTASNSTSASSRALVSPLQMTFDFELPPSPALSSPVNAPFRASIESSLRPESRDGFMALRAEGERNMSGSRAPPMLPPIPRVASQRREESGGSVAEAWNEVKENDREMFGTQTQPQARYLPLREAPREPLSRPAVPEEAEREREDTDNISTSSSFRRRSQMKATLSFDSTPDFLPFSTPTFSAGISPNILQPPQLHPEARPATASAGSTPRMESSLFPTRDVASSAAVPLVDTTPAMTRAFIDTRDRVYAPPTSQPKRPTNALQPTHSSPDLLAIATRQASTNFSTRTPLSAASPTSAQRPSPLQSAHTSPNLLKHVPTNFSGSTVRSTLSSRSTAADSTFPAPTIGTPYQETSPSFPPPQLVAIRPKTAGSPMATVGGVGVPTHHSSALLPLRPDTAGASGGGKAEKAEPKTEKSERRRTRLLNPMALLSRRRSGQDEEPKTNEKAAQAAQAQALQRQKNVAAVGVSKLPEDFDPRIRGKVVHDFSAPRQNRQTRQWSYNDASGAGPEPAWNAVARGLQSANSAPYIPTLPEDPTASDGAATGSGQKAQPRSLHSNKHTSESSSSGSVSATRKSMLHGMFREHLNDNPDSGQRIQAERLENKDFLQRASHLSQQSGVSEESAVLPPFARRSQVLDPSQAAYFQDDDSKRSSDPGYGSGREHGVRDSGISSISGVSPVTARSSGMGANVHHDASAASMSPVSPTSPDKRGSGGGSAMRPLSLAVSPPEQFVGRPPSSYFSSGSKGTGPGVEAIAEEDSTPMQHFSTRIPMPPRAAPGIPPPGPHTGAGSPHGTAGSRTASLLGSSGWPSPSIQSLPSNQPTPEPQIADAAVLMKPPTSPPKLVEKRASAVGHAKRRSQASTNGNGLPRHHISNASRFSFQFGGSSAEEQALEEKARHMRHSGEDVDAANVPGEDEDDDDIFDEDAMDDMDEMELQDELQERKLPSPSSGSGRASVAQFMYRPATVTKPSGGRGIRKSRLELEAQDDDDSGISGSDDGNDDDDDDGDEAPYWMHEDFRDYSSLDNRSRDPSLSEQGTGSDPPIAQPRPQRRSGGSAVSRLSIDTSVAPGATVMAPAAAFVLQTVGEKTRSGFYMQPQAAGYSPTSERKSLGLQQIDERPALPHRDSGNSERNRAASGLNFSSSTLGDNAETKHHAALSSSTVGSGMSTGNGRPFSQSTVGDSSLSEPRTTSTGLGLSGFSDFKFSDSAPPSRPMSYQAGMVKENENRRTKDSETMPRNVDFIGSSKASPSMGHGRNSSGWGSDGAGIAYVGRGVNSRQPSSDLRKSMLNLDDDMYFDDGGFDDDVGEGPRLRDSIDEDAFDDERVDFDRVNGIGQAVAVNQPPAMQGHQREVSALTVTSLGSDGPYPSFAMPNPVRARQRDSSMLLEDLPLQEVPVDPQLIPRRNPSEDAKRLGLSSRAPPLPPVPGSLEAAQRVQANLQAYHAALAVAANKAAAEGRFLRTPTVSSARSLSVRSGEESDDKTQQTSRDDRSHYSRNEDGHMIPQGDGPAEGTSDLERNESVETTYSMIDRTANYSPPPRLSFDFGFDALPLDAGTADDFDFNDDDDDIVAAANAEALASDDEGWYGQEFGFYAKARPNSGDLQAVNGGFFGQDGDDGLMRNKSLKEPNLTPITERSEFSTRNSFIGFGGPFGLPSAAPHSASSWGPISPALARLPISPLGENEITSFDQLRKLRAHAFAGSNASLHSDGKGGPLHGESPTLSTRSSAAAQGYFGPLGGAPMTFGYSTDSSGSSNPSSAHPLHFGHHFQDSPHSAASSGHLPFSMSMDHDGTPKRTTVDVPLPARKVGTQNFSVANKVSSSHSRTSSGTESVTYVQEQDPSGTGPPRWVLERRRTSEQGQLEVIAREIVQGGWI